MNILQINASYKPAYVYGGPTISVSTLCEELVQAGENVTVITTTANGKEELAVKTGAITLVEHVPVRYFKRLTKGNSHLSLGLLYFLSKNLRRYDVIHIHAWWNLVSVGSAFICFLANKRFVFSPRGTLSTYSFFNKKSLSKRAFHFFIGKRLLKNAIFQVSSKKEAEDIERVIGKMPVTVIPNFIQLHAAWNIECATKTKRPLRLLFFSRIEHKKGLEYLFKALADLSFDFTLDIYGAGEPSYIAALKESVPAAISGSINWRGVVYGDQKFTTLSQYDVMVLPSYDENFANVVIESLSVGTPVLVTRKVGLSDYVEQNNLGWVCEQNEKDITSKLEMINGNTSLLNSIRIVAPGKIKEDFSARSLLLKYRNFYNKLIKEYEPI